MFPFPGCLSSQAIPSGEMPLTHRSRGAIRSNRVSERCIGAGGVVGEEVADCCSDARARDAGQAEFGTMDAVTGLRHGQREVLESKRYAGAVIGVSSPSGGRGRIGRNMWEVEAHTDLLG